jgi:Polyketide cyclase / dehydrase and lipid transport
MDVSDRLTRRITVACSAAVLYDMISDVSRVGEWSPVCRAGESEDGSSPSVGAVFVGHNVTPGRSWDMRCRVFVADRGREFAFATIGTPGGDDTNEDGMTRWGYTFTAIEGGTDVEESWQLTPSGLETVNAMPEAQRDTIVETVMPNTLSGMEETLANLKRVAEAG